MSEHDLRQVRAAQNQALFRSVNERLRELNQSFELLTDRSVFVCECAHISCSEQIDMKLADYERIRANPRRFVVAPSDAHVVPDVEHVVETTETYYVVEKIGAAAEVAERNAER